MNKYTYTVGFRIIGTEMHHSMEFGNAPAACSAAMLTYAALQSTYEPEVDVLPHFGMIRHRACVRHKAEPRNKSFMVEIVKTPR